MREQIDYNEPCELPSHDQVLNLRTPTAGSHVSILKPTPELPQVATSVCPFCGKKSYSRDGIHPQCALNQADAARNEKLRASRKAAQKVEKPAANRRHLSKSCPECGTNVHIRVMACACGHVFGSSRS